MDRVSYKRFVFDASNTDAEVYAKQCDLILLALIGFIAMGHGNWAKVKYAQDDSDFVLAANRLQLFSPEVSFDELRAAVPDNEGPAPNLNQENADTVCQALVKLLKGLPIALDKLPDIQARSEHADIPPSQAELAASQAPSARNRPEEPPVLTQVVPEEGADEEPPAKRLRNEPLEVADLCNHREAMTKMLAWVLKQKNHSIFQWRLNEKVREVHPTTEKSYLFAAKITKLLVSATLAMPTPDKTNSFDLVKIPEAARISITAELEKVTRGEVEGRRAVRKKSGRGRLPRVQVQRHHGIVRQGLQSISKLKPSKTSSRSSTDSDKMAATCPIGPIASFLLLILDYLYPVKWLHGTRNA